MALAPQGKQPQSKGKGKGKGKSKAKSGGGGAGGSLSSKAVAGPLGVSSSGQASSSQGSGRPSAPTTHSKGLGTAVQAALPAASEASSSSQQPQPQPGSSKADKEKARKERQWQRHTEQARHVLYEAIYRVEDTASLDAECMQAAEEAMHIAAKYASRCESLAALVELAKTTIEQARAAAEERARMAAAEAAAAAEVAAATEAAKAAERLRIEEEMSELILRMQSDAMRLQQMQAQLSVVPPAALAPQSEAEEVVCVVCMDAPKSHAILPCMHQCVCATCAQQLKEQGAQSCPVCRGLIERIAQVFT
jgi:hypothetical protein